jgi:molybdopterin converting factor small subunit
MSVSVRIPTILRTYTDGSREVSVEPGEPTLAGVLDALEAAAPGIRARVLDDTGALRRFVNVYVDDDDVRFTDGLATPIKDGAHVSIIPAVAGG